MTSNRVFEVQGSEPQSFGFDHHLKNNDICKYDKYANMAEFHGVQLTALNVSAYINIAISYWL